jgi:thioredoxin 2
MESSMASPFRVACPACAAVNRIAAGRPAAEALCGTCRARLFTGKPTEVDEQELDHHLRNSDIPVLLDVWAPWCGPCRSMAPEFARAAPRLEPGVRLLKLNADAAQATVARLGVRGIPALVLFRGGTVLAQSAGARGAADIVAWTEANLAGSAAVTAT